MLSLICNRASICKQSVKALMGISTEFYSDKIDINFIDVNAKSLWPFSTFVNQVLKFYSHFACSERLRKFPIKYGDLYICGRGVRKLPVQYWHRNHRCIWLRKNVNVALVDYLYQGFYALYTLYGTFVTWEFWFTNEISKRRWEKCITNGAEWMSSSVLHCNVTVAAWRRETTRDVGAAL